MIDVLVYVYENYWRPAACPESARFARKLSAAGFDIDEIEAALDWLEGLKLAAATTQQLPAQPAILPRPGAEAPMRAYSPREQDHLGADALGFIMFLEGAGVLSAPLREMVVERALAIAGEPVSLEDLKVIVLMVFWSLGEEPDALVLDELCDDSATRVAH